jgi:hypothetical protein
MPGIGFDKYLILILISKKMKKEKMSLKSIKNVLSRAEMKNIMAGSGKGNPVMTCTNTEANGSWWVTTFAFYNTLDEAQDEMDRLCGESNSCQDITCKFV